MVLNPLGIRNRMGALRGEWLAFRRHHPKAARRTLAGATLVSALLAIGGIWFLSGLLRGLPSRSEVERIGEMDQATAVYDRDDQIVFTIFKEQRIEVPLAGMSPHLIQAVVAIEDQRFYDHHGFDLIRIAAAALSNVRIGGVFFNGPGTRHLWLRSSLG